MLPPNPAEQVNPPVDDWLQLHNIWAALQISPSLLRPEYVGYEDPGGKRWGQGCLLDAPREGTVHAFVADCAGVKQVDLVLRGAGGEQRLPMRNHGPYPTRTGARLTADYVTAGLPVGAGDVRCFIEAEDGRGNVSRGALERIFLA